jgi:hypothetical protein
MKSTGDNEKPYKSVVSKVAFDFAFLRNCSKLEGSKNELFIYSRYHLKNIDGE